MKVTTLSADPLYLNYLAASAMGYEVEVAVSGITQLLGVKFCRNEDSLLYHGWSFDPCNQLAHTNVFFLGAYMSILRNGTGYTAIAGTRSAYAESASKALTLAYVLHMYGEEPTLPKSFVQSLLSNLP